ncbi:MAG: ABC transporter permease [Acidobacteria bacterium]|nr:ABC transporter permease [Acidobacteriota bacterium]
MAGPSFAERVYRLLLRCYPGEFRDEYEREMLQAFRDRLHSDRRVGFRAIVRLWWQLVVDSIIRAPGEHLDVLGQDIRHALRSFRRAPVFAFTAIATLALGVGANTAVYSVVHAVALRPLPYESADRLVRIWEKNDALALSGFSASLPNYLSWRERSQTMRIAAWRAGNVTLRSTGDPVRVPSATTAADFFEILNVAPVAGRLFVPGDDAGGASRVAVITAALWRRHFGEQPGVVGSTVMIAGNPHTIIGVIGEDAVPSTAEFFMPLRVNPKEETRDNHVAQVIGRLNNGVTFQQAQAEIDAIARQLEAEFPASNKGWGITMSTLYDWAVPPEMRRALYVLLGAVCCVLLIACSNVANLMLARAAARRREIALRVAIGAARRRLVRQVLTEGVVLSACGGAAGVLLAYWSMPLLREWLPSTLPRATDAAVSAPVLWFSVALCTLTGLAFSLVPALAASRGDVIEALKEGARGSSSAGHRSRQLLASAQVALATILLVGAALLVQSLQRLEHVDLGFDPGGITAAMLGLPNDRYGDSNASWAFYERMLDRLTSSPGVTAAALSSGAPFGGGNTGMPINAVGPSRLNAEALQTDWRMVSPGYFSAMRIPLLRGRSFTGAAADGENRLVVSAAMARRMWGDEDPVGRQIKAGPNGLFTVIGVVGDVRNLDLSLDPAPTMYLSATRYVWPTMTVIVRTTGANAQPANLLRGVVRELDPQLALHNVRDMETLISESASQPRLNASLTGLFAVIAALLAALGIYGVLAYLVSQRRQEIGIRLALGASRTSVLRLFLRRGAGLAGGGLVAGVAGALAASRWIESMVFGVSARDPWTFAGAILAIGLVALCACYIPARRATRVDPLLALRND